jgi:hypothetical protein
VLLAAVELEEVPDEDDAEEEVEEDESLEEDELSPEADDDSLLAAPDAAVDPLRESVR